MTSPTSPTAPRIFVSHSHADNAFCRAFVAGLRNVGLEVWYDEHNLGWGELRQVIERELASSQHFIAILSPAAVASPWVNREIDAALALLGEKHLTTFLLVTAAPCTVPLLLRGFKRVEGSGGAAVPVSEAIESTVRILVPPARLVASPGPQVVMPPDQFPDRLALLGFVAERVNDPQTSRDVSFIVPPTVSVSDGPFQMGSDRMRDADTIFNEYLRTVNVAAFVIARYPVTVAEYACFVCAGYNEPQLSAKGVDWARQLTRLDHPVTCVSWHDAIAYAEWLGRLSGQPWRLPSEEEWEKAARWDPHIGKSHIYPWGDAFDVARCNTSESKIGTTTPVGKYGASGASPYGAEDMAGNVFEWTSSRYGTTADSHVFRGGSWRFDRQYARSARKEYGAPDSPSFEVGIRLALAQVRLGSPAHPSAEAATGITNRGKNGNTRPFLRGSP